MHQVFAIVLAGGRGTRLKNYYSFKPILTLIDKPLIKYIVNTIEELEIEDINIVVNSEIENMIKEMFPKCSLWIQEKSDGTGGAIRCCKPLYDAHPSSVFLIMCADTPLVEKKDLEKALEHFIKSNSDLSVLCFKDIPHGSYGVLSTKRKNRVSNINESKEYRPNKKRLLNTGIYLIKSDLLSLFDNKLLKHGLEYNLTDLIHLAYINKKKVTFYEIPKENGQGINTYDDLVMARQILSERAINKLINNGVDFISKSSCLIGTDVTIGSKTVVYPNNIILGKTIIKDNVKILGNNVINNSSIGQGSVVGPFCHLREGTILDNNVKAGAFVEIKKSIVSSYTKIPHLSYIGDSVIGKETNIGAGVITANYDGKNKYQTVIGDNCFIGTQCTLIAPLKVGNESFVGASTCLDENIEEKSFVIRRANLDIRKNKKARP